MHSTQRRCCTCDIAQNPLTEFTSDHWKCNTCISASCSITPQPSNSNLSCGAPLSIPPDSVPIAMTEKVAISSLSPHPPIKPSHVVGTSPQSQMVSNALASDSIFVELLHETSTFMNILPMVSVETAQAMVAEEVQMELEALRQRFQDLDAYNAGLMMAHDRHVQEIQQLQESIEIQLQQEGEKVTALTVQVETLQQQLEENEEARQQLKMLAQEAHTIQAQRVGSQISELQDEVEYLRMQLEHSNELEDEAKRLQGVVETYASQVTKESQRADILANQLETMKKELEESQLAQQQWKEVAEEANGAQETRESERVSALMKEVMSLRSQLQDSQQELQLFRTSTEEQQLTRDQEDSEKLMALVDEIHELKEQLQCTEQDRDQWKLQAEMAQLVQAQQEIEQVTALGKEVIILKSQLDESRRAREKTKRLAEETHQEQVKYMEEQMQAFKVEIGTLRDELQHTIKLNEQLESQKVMELNDEVKRLQDKLQQSQQTKYDIQMLAEDIHSIQAQQESLQASEWIQQAQLLQAKLEESHRAQEMMKKMLDTAQCMQKCEAQRAAEQISALSDEVEFLRHQLQNGPYVKESVQPTPHMADCSEHQQGQNVQALSAQVNFLQTKLAQSEKAQEELKTLFDRAHLAQTRYSAEQITALNDKVNALQGQLQHAKKAKEDVKRLEVVADTYLAQIKHLEEALAAKEHFMVRTQRTPQEEQQMAHSARQMQREPESIQSKFKESQMNCTELTSFKNHMEQLLPDRRRSLPSHYWG